MLQISPFERARRADLELLAQGLWIMVVDQLQRLAGQQRIEAAKNQGVALAGRNFAYIDDGILGGSHGKAFLGEVNKSNEK